MPTVRWQNPAGNRLPARENNDLRNRWERCSENDTGRLRVLWRIDRRSGLGRWFRARSNARRRTLPGQAVRLPRLRPLRLHGRRLPDDRRRPKQAAAGQAVDLAGRVLRRLPQVDLALLAKGFHLVYINVGNTFGCPDAMKHWDVLYKELTEKHGLSPKPVLEGLSRGGLYCFNWAADNPDKVACILADNAVLDFKSWPGGKGKGKGSPGDWKKLLQDYHFQSEAEALAYTKNPVDNLAAAGQGQGAPVPALRRRRRRGSLPGERGHRQGALREARRPGQVLIKKGMGHHPHGLDDPTPVVEYILKHAGTIPASPAGAAKPIRNYTAWTDTAGNPISCHDGGITRVGDTFYWYGTSYKGNPKGLWGRKAAHLQQRLQLLQLEEPRGLEVRGRLLRSFPRTAGWPRAPRTGPTSSTTTRPASTCCGSSASARPSRSTRRRCWPWPSPTSRPGRSRSSASATRPRSTAGARTWGCSRTRTARATWSTTTGTATSAWTCWPTTS